MPPISLETFTAVLDSQAALWEARNLKEHKPLYLLVIVFDTAVAIVTADAIAIDIVILIALDTVTASTINFVTTVGIVFSDVVARENARFDC